MSTKPYTPLPGSIASRTIAWLMEQPDKISYSAAVIADALDFDPSALSACITPAVVNGLIIKERIEGLTVYRKGDGMPLHRPTDPDDAALAIAQVWTPAPTATEPTTPSTSAPANAATPRKTRRGNGPGSDNAMYDEIIGLHDKLKTQQPAPVAPASTGFFVGASMGGEIQIHKGGVVLTLDDKEFAFAVRMAAAAYPNMYIPE